MKKLVITALLSVLLNAPSLRAETIFSYNTGRDYMDMTEDFRDIYVQGLLDQWFLTLAIYNDFETIVWLEECTAGMRSDEVASMFTDWLGWHEEDLVLTAPELFIAAIVETCDDEG